jgi:Fic family protein
LQKTAFIKPSGTLKANRDGHLTFLPNSLPPQINYDESLVSLISEASSQLGILRGIGEFLPNPHLLIRPYVKREAVLSSKIEGTQASIIDVFRYEAGGMEHEEERERKGIMEVVNYVSALETCLDEIRRGARLELWMIKYAHKILMSGVRGQERQPGEIRLVQNWIGIEGTPIDAATYVPPPPEYVKDLLVDLEDFIQHPRGRMAPLVQIALIHYQFEAIHPFSDGNGRIGRLLIPILLAERSLLSQPLLYISAYFEANKDEYYKRLLGVSQRNEWIEWVRFFLHGVISQAGDAAKNIEKLMALKRRYESELMIRKASGSATRLVDYLFENPISNIPRAARRLGLTYPAAKNVIESLKKIGILVELDDVERRRTFVAHEVLKLLS